MNRQQRITQLLTESLKPQSLTVIDDSLAHAGHQGLKEHSAKYQSTETHFKVEVVSEVFEGLTRLDRQRLVNEALKNEFTTGLHALEIKTKSLSEK